MGRAQSGGSHAAIPQRARATSRHALRPAQICRRELIAAPARRIQQRNAAMKSLSWLFACAGLAAIIAGPASAQNPPVPLIDGPTYLMTYLEVIPSANARAIAMLKEYRDASRKEPGANYVDIYQEEGQSHRFILTDIWHRRGMAADHAKDASIP